MAKKKIDKSGQMNLESLFGAEKVYSILELNSAVRDTIKKGFSQYVWVCGEIQDYRPYRSGHIYFNCVEKDPDSDKIVAQVSAALFAPMAPKIFAKLKEIDSKFELKNDIEVKLLSQLDLYVQRGQFQIKIVDIDPAYTLGKIAQNRQKIIADLKKRGLLDKNKNIIFPEVPLRIGLITSVDSAAYHDFINELSLSGYGFKVQVFGAHMQGKLVEPDVLRALDYFSRLDKSCLDAIVITRGGGSTADLSYFDSKKIAERIAALDFPVVAAVGHQINTTIIDLMAHTSCKTPTAAAQSLAAKVQVFLEGLSGTEKEIFGVAEGILSRQKQILQNTALRFDAAVPGYFRVQREMLLEAKHSALNFAKTYFQNQKNKVADFAGDILSSSKKMLDESRRSLKHMSEKVSLLDPKNIFKRGYSATYLKGKAIKSSKDLKLGDRIKTYLYEGWIDSDIINKDK